MSSMSQKVERNKVGDVDPVGRAAFRREMEKAGRAVAPRKPVAPAKKPPRRDPPLDTQRRARQIEGQLKKLGE